jgi:hypothetical protein
MLLTDLEHVQLAKSIHMVMNRITTTDCRTGCDAIAAAYNSFVQFSAVKIWYIPKKALYILPKFVGWSGGMYPRSS